MGRLAEKYYPLGLSFLVVAVYAWLLRKSYIPGTVPASLKDLLTALLTVSSIMVGFLATAKAILLSIDSRRIIHMLKEADRYVGVIDFMLSAIYWSFGLALVCTFGLLLDYSTTGSAHPRFVGILIFAISGCAFSGYRIIHIFAKILKSPE